MIDNCTIFDFDGKKIRAVWNAEQNKYYFAVTDIVQVLTDCSNVKQYLKQIRNNNLELDSKWSSICHKVEMMSTDGKRPKIESADLEGILCIIEAIPSEKKEPIRQFLDEMVIKHIEQKADSKFSRIKHLIKRKLILLLFVFILALFPWMFVFIQDNNTSFGADIDEFADFYKNDISVDDTTFVFFDVNSNLKPTQSDDSLWHLTVDHTILIDFLQYVNEHVPTYKCVLFDIQLFKENLHPKRELEFAQLLNSMYNIPQKVFIANKRYNELPDSLKKHSVRINYEGNKYGMYVRGEFLDMEDGKETVALKMYNSIHNADPIIYHETIIKSIYHIGWDVFRKNPVVKILKKIEDFNEMKIIPLDSFKVTNLNDKIIIIGDIEGKRDVHCTYANKIEGPYLIYCEYKALEKGLQIFPKDILLWLLVVYFSITLFIIKIKLSFNVDKVIGNKRMQDFINRWENETIKDAIKAVVLTLSALLDVMIKFGTVYCALWLLRRILYYNFDFLYSLYFPLFWFTILEIIVVFNLSRKKG